MDYSKLAEALGVKNVILSEDEDIYLLFDNYIPYGGGGAGSKNGHYGCKHSEDAKKIMSEKKKGKTTWNKGITGYSVHTDKSKKAMSEKLSGSKNGRAILDESTARKIISFYISKPIINDAGKVQKNGIIMSYDWAFCKSISQEYGITPAAIKRLIHKQSWKNVWSEYEV